jgi:N-acetylmuramoyl-L-alanine amidase
MNKFTKFLLTLTMIASLFTIPMNIDAASYQVQEGDSFHSIAKKFSTTITNLQIANKRSGNVLYPGETIQVPDNIAKKDKELMARLVHAEAKGEPYEGKVAVATVVLNRVDHEEFPETIRDVIYEKTGEAYAFTPVQNGEINGDYTDEDMKAVNEAIAYRGQGDESIYFYNPKTSTSEWIFSRETTVTIGNHRFAK